MTEPRNITDAIRSVEIGPFGPNSLDIIRRGGMVALTSREADDIKTAIRPFVVSTERIRAALRLLHNEMTSTAVRQFEKILDDEENRHD